MGSRRAAVPRRARRRGSCGPTNANQILIGLMFKVECESCKAPYQIDERRVPSAGLKMRCPKCGHSFVVTLPAANEAPSADLPAVVARAPQAPAGAAGGPRPGPPGAGPPRPPPAPAAGALGGAAGGFAKRPTNKTMVG